jgi:predicted lactoylglutathione lyase
MPTSNAMRARYRPVGPSSPYADRVTVPPRSSLVTLGVQDVERSTAFYLALGWELSSSSVPGDVSFFRLGGAALAVWGRRDLAADVGAGAAEKAPAFREVTVAINVADDGEVDAAPASAAAAGGTILVPAHRADWGGFTGYFGDPDGHVWEVAHNPYWPLDDAGLPVLP